MKTQSELIAELEPLVDASSLSDVILALARVCDEKAEHLAINWQDENAAKEWSKAARTLDKTAEKVEI